MTHRIAPYLAMCYDIIDPLHLSRNRTNIRAFLGAKVTLSALQLSYHLYIQPPRVHPTQTSTPSYLYACLSSEICEIKHLHKTYIYQARRGHLGPAQPKPC
jgi:hypothetical protein